MPKSSKWSQWKKVRSLAPNDSQIQTSGKQHLLFFCPSLGEYEAVRSLIDHLKAKDTDIFIEVTCFSPSAYQSLTGAITHQADLISYSPIDTKQEVTAFFTSRDVKRVIFSSLVLWPELTNHLITKSIPYDFVGAQVKRGLLKSIYYKSLSKYLIGAEKVLTIEEEDADTLSAISKEIKTVVCGDPRIDSIKDQLKKSPSLEKIQNFCNGQQVIIFGSTHEEDEALIIPILDQLVNSNYKVIIAPHDVVRSESIAREIDSVQLFSSLSSGHAGAILIMDQLGWLKHMYILSSIAYIGGGFSDEIHNVVEPLLANNVIITGPKLSKSYISQQLKKENNLAVVHTSQELHLTINSLSNKERRKTMASKSEEILSKYAGATEKIISTLKI